MIALPCPGSAPLIGLVGCALVLSSLATGGFVHSANPSRRALVAACVFVLAVVPLDGESLAARARGLTGDFAVTTVVFAVAVLAGRADRTRSVRRFVLAAAAVLYPMALGLGPFDPYALGYAPIVLPMALIVIGLLAWWREAELLVLALGLAQIAFALRLYESDNLWDYIVDPWIVVAAAVWAVASNYDFRARRRRS